MKDEREDLFEALRRAVLEAKGVLPREKREAAFRGEGELAAKIHEHAYRVTAEEIAALAASEGEDAVFELAVAAAVGAGSKRLEALKRVLP